MKFKDVLLTIANVRNSLVEKFDTYFERYVFESMQTKKAGVSLLQFVAMILLFILTVPLIGASMLIAAGGVFISLGFLIAALSSPLSILGLALYQSVVQHYKKYNTHIKDSNTEVRPSEQVSYKIKFAIIAVVACIPAVVCSVYIYNDLLVTMKYFVIDMLNLLIRFTRWI